MTRHPDELGDTRALLSIDAARDAVIAAARPITGIERVPLQAARGRLIATTLTSPRALPIFDHSAMDGYALALHGTQRQFRLVGHVGAGHVPARRLAPGEAMRIFTGAPIPAGADAVVMQEHATPGDETIRVDQPVVAGDNIRHAGEDVAERAELIPAGRLLDARHIGLAAAAGLTEIDVLRKLRIALVSVGDELVSGAALAPGQIFDSNRPMLAAALERPGVEIEDYGTLPDDRDAIRDFFRRAGETSDLIVTTGGASVGDEEHIAGSLMAAGGRQQVANVGIRPGKPFIYGAIGRAAVAILPGNPFAALVTGLLFVRPQVERALGLTVQPFSPTPARAGFEQRRAKHRTGFLPARIMDRNERGTPVLERLGPSGSGRLRPLIDADGLAVIAPGDGAVRLGDPIGFLPFGAAFAL